VFAIGIRRGLGMPDLRQVFANGENLLPLLGRDLTPILSAPRLVVALGGLDGAKGRFPLTLQRARYQPMIGFYGVILALGPLGS
jgi:hypothetical protein